MPARKAASDRGVESIRQSLVTGSFWPMGMAVTVCLNQPNPGEILGSFLEVAQVAGQVAQEGRPVTRTVGGMG